MKTLKKSLTLVFSSTCAALASLSASTPYIWSEGHGHIRFDYDNASETWVGRWDNEDGGPSGSYENAIGAHTLPAHQAVYWYADVASPAGARISRPASSDFDFLGVPAGAPIWFNPANAGWDYESAWLGFDTTGSFGAYMETDERLGSFKGPAQWVTLHLDDMRFSGAGDGNLAIYEFGSGGPIVWINTVDGIDETDLWIQTNGHTHQNWAFTALGIYQLDMWASAFLGPGATNPTSSEIFTFTIGVGTHAHWTLSHFSIEDAVDETVGGPLADPDGDGVVNLLEYAFNMDPNVPLVATLVPASGTSGLPAHRLEDYDSHERLVIEFVRRKAATHPQIIYYPEFSGDLSTDNWQEPLAMIVTSINSTWERVVAYDPTPHDQENPRRFARVRVELVETIDYE